HRKSWVSPDVKKAPRLLFVSDDGTDDVYIFTMPAMTLKGTLTGFAEPQGMCTDKSGNVWIVNTETSQVFQYSRAGTFLRSVSVGPYLPAGCAVNKANGDLAVTNLIGTIGGSGNVEIFADGSSSGTEIVNPNQSYYYFPAYDTVGNLYVDGFTSDESSILSKCAPGSGTCSTLSVSGGSIFLPGGLNWDQVHNQLVVGDQSCNDEEASCLYAMTISGSTATIAGSNPLNDYDGGGCDVDQGTLAPRASYFAGPCLSRGSGSNAVARWLLPAGGTPTHYSATHFPIGSAISNK
ncbi:MAG TPA: hypothetical protein VFE16_05255, partial [Candidatus Cybelea sp.]|nr:hypothetical protein [Candidatus Cybelea sp.]